MIQRSIFLLLLIAVGCQHQSLPPIEHELVGNDLDEHGCKGSAGYTWSIIRKNCIRPFELSTRLINSDSSAYAALIPSENEDSIEVFCWEVPKEQRIFKRIDNHVFKNPQNFLLVKSDFGYNLETTNSTYK